MDPLTSMIKDLGLSCERLNTGVESSETSSTSASLEGVGSSSETSSTSASSEYLEPQQLELENCPCNGGLATLTVQLPDNNEEDISIVGSYGEYAFTFSSGLKPQEWEVWYQNFGKDVFNILCLKNVLCLNLRGLLSKKGTSISYRDTGLIIGKDKGNLTVDDVLQFLKPEGENPEKQENGIVIKPPTLKIPFNLLLTQEEHKVFIQFIPASRAICKPESTFPFNEWGVMMGFRPYMPLVC